MTIEAVAVTIISSLLSGLIGVIASFYFYQRLERRKMRMDTVRKLFGGRYAVSSKEFQEAINAVMIVFSDSEDVIAAMEEFYTTLQTPRQHLAPGVGDEKLMKAICRDLGIKRKNLPDVYFLRNFKGSPSA